jgi:hypothetical protein
MTIRTKFNKKDKVWIMEGNRPTEKEIISISVKVMFDTIDVYYEFAGYGRDKVNEHLIYQTKQDLIESL